WAASTPIKSDFRAAAQLIREQAESQDRVLFVTPYIERSFHYYGPDAPPTLPTPYIGPLSVDEVGEELDQFLADDPEVVERVWLVLSEPETYDPKSLIPAVL